MDYEREAGKIKFSGEEFIPDFTFRSYDLALEAKLVRAKQQIFNCIEEMSADIPANLSAFKNLLFCVCDLGAIRDVNESKEGLQRQSGVRVCVIKH